MSYQYWDYYISLEEDLIATKRYVDFCDDNMSTYSIEFARIILSTCAEIDMVFKEICKILQSQETGKSARCDNVKKYRETILKHDPSFRLRKRYIAHARVTVTPFQDWSLQSGTNPEWWRSYNAIKHERSSAFHRATLSNAIESLTGLQVVLFEYYSILHNLKRLSFNYGVAPKLILPVSAGSIISREGMFIEYLK